MPGLLRPGIEAEPRLEPADHGRGRVAVGMNDQAIPREALLSLPEVMRLTTLRQSAIYARMNAGTFPASRQVGLRKVAWPAGEVLDWIAALPKRTPSGRPAATAKPAVCAVAKSGSSSRSGEAIEGQDTRPPPMPRSRVRRNTAA